MYPHSGDIKRKDPTSDGLNMLLDQNKTGLFSSQRWTQAWADFNAMYC